MKSGNPSPLSPPPPAPVTRVNLLPSRSARLQLYLALQEKISLLSSRPAAKVQIIGGVLLSKPNHFLNQLVTIITKQKANRSRFSKSCPFFREVQGILCICMQACLLLHILYSLCHTLTLSSTMV